MLERMEAFFENRLAGYDEHMLASIEGAREFYRFTASLLPMEEKSVVLDLGCGTGLELEEYFLLNPSACVTGIDLSAAMLGALARKFPDRDLRLIHGSYFEESFEVGRYAAIVSVESLHHFTEKQKLSLYQRLLQALAVGGYFILTDYFADTDELERDNFVQLDRLKQEQNISGQAFYHYDTPLTVEHEMDILIRAGFSDVSILKHWGATYTVKAMR